LSVRDPEIGDELDGFRLTALLAELRDPPAPPPACRPAPGPAPRSPRATRLRRRLGATLVLAGVLAGLASLMWCTTPTTGRTSFGPAGDRPAGGTP
jgi:ferric-dicitrate binding protein FerR (iron transport regulator)